VKPLFIILFLFTSAVSIAQRVVDQDFISKMRLAQISEQTRDFTNAVRLYRELYEIKPEFPEVSEGLFRSLFALKKFDEAEKVVRTRITYEGESFDIYISLAQVLAKQNKRRDAVEAFMAAEKQGAEFHPYSLAVSISQAMVDVGLAEDALEYLKRTRGRIEESVLLSGEIGSLLFKIGNYEEGTKEYLSMLAKNETQLGLIQSRISVFTQDSLVRKTILTTISQNIEIKNASVPQLRLLAWSYGELQDYQNAYQVVLALDDRSSVQNAVASGGELYQFAERARTEGSLEVAVAAYEEALKRLKKTSANDPRREYFLSQTELGVLKTKAQFALTKDTASISKVVHEFELFANENRHTDLSLEAYQRAGDLAFKKLFGLERAHRIYTKLIERSSGTSGRTREAYFALEEISLAKGDLAAANENLEHIEKLLAQRSRSEDADMKNRIVYERGRIEFYNGNFDSAFSILTNVASDAASEYANDAIFLRTFIEENQEEGANAALKLYARAELSILAHDYWTAFTTLESVYEGTQNALVTDDAILRSADMLVEIGAPHEAVTLLETMQDKMSKSPLVDKAGFRAAEIEELNVQDKSKAQKMYEDFLERYDKSPYVTEARKRARKLRGDSF
jgi:lipopolysaccharide biosynthesis regulator YciM